MTIKIINGVITTVIGVCALALTNTAYADLTEPYKQVCISLGSATQNTDERRNFQSICNNLVVISDADDNDAVAALRHEEVAAQGTTALESSRRHVSNISARIGIIRRAAVGGSSGDVDDNELLESSRWGVFGNGNFNNGDRTQTVKVSGGEALGDASTEIVQGERAFDFEGKDLSVGIDYRFPGDKMIIGTALGYSRLTSDFTTEKGKTDLKGHHISVFGTYLLSEKTYFDGVISIGRSNINASRPVPVFVSDQDTVLTDGLALADTNARQISISLGTGYEFNTGALNITPFSRFDYNKTNIDAYTETVQDKGGSSNRDSRGMILSVDKQHIDSLVGTLGIKASYPISSSSGVFLPQVTVELKRQFRNDDRFIEATLPVATDLANVNTDPNSKTSKSDRNYARLGVGVSAVFPKGRSGYLQIESLQGSDDLSETAIKAGFRMEF